MSAQGCLTHAYARPSNNVLQVHESSVDISFYQADNSEKCYMAETWHWLALVGTGWHWLTLVGIGGHWLTLVNIGWHWLAFG